jgi:outer membrane protein assembly factor BamB
MPIDYDVRMRGLVVAVALTVLAACGGGDTKPGRQASPSTTSTTAGSSSSSSSPPGSAPTTANTSTDWPMFQRDAQHTGLAVASTLIGDPKQAWRSRDLDGTLYASPLIVGNRVIAATEGNSVYALDAQTGKQEWRTHFGDPVNGGDLPCGNIDPSGITGTPVVAGGVVYVVAFLADGFHHELYALNIDTGAVRWHRSIDPPGLSGRVEQQRAAVTVANGRVYVAYGGLYGDCGPYKGAVVSSALDGTGSLQSFVVPTTREAGIWAPAGPVVDPQGRIYVSTGNSESRSTFDYGNAVIRLSPDLKVQDYWGASDWVQLNENDADVGSLSPVLVGTDRVFVAGKNGTGYLMSTAAMGHVGGERDSLHLCSGAFGGAVWVDPIVIVPCVDGLFAVQVNGEKLSRAWKAIGSSVGSPILAGGAIWVTDQGGTLHAIDANSGSSRFDLRVGSVTRFTTPAASLDHVVVGAGRNIVALSLG